jgi:CubicO group peptidase (beta-lactamase class C family)
MSIARFWFEIWRAHAPGRTTLVHICLTMLLLMPAFARAADLNVQTDTLLARLYADGHFSGAVVIGQNGAILHESAIGQADASRPFTVDSVAEGASLAKPVTAAAIWQLVAAGRIGLDDPVVRHVAEFPYPGVTVRHLLSHTAGLPNYDAFQPVMDAGEPVDNLALQGLMRRVASQPVFPPGSAFEYCNICYDTLALLIERVTGRSYADVARIGILAAAGARTAFLRPVRLSDWPGQRTLGYRSARPDAELFDIFDNEAFYGSSNLQFSARDLHAWATAWAAGRVLPVRARRQASAPARIGTAASALSLTNWYCAGQRCYFTGHHQGFFSLVYWDARRRLTAVYISNSSLPPPLHPWLGRSLVALAEGRPTEPMAPVPPAEAQLDVASVAGHYRINGVGKLIVQAEGDGARIRLPGGVVHSAFPVGHAMLYVPGVDAYLAFGPGPVLRWSSLFLMAKGHRLKIR